MAITINKKQRRRLRQVVFNDVYVIGDIDLCIRQGDWATAKRLRRQCEGSLRLLDDLGWEDVPPAVIELTMPTAELMRTLARLQAGVLGGAASALRCGEYDSVNREAKLADAIAEVLDQLSTSTDSTARP